MKSEKLTSSERRLIVEVGSQWMRKSDAEVLGEAAVLFRLAVAIVGVKGREQWRKKTGTTGSRENHLTIDRHAV